MSQHSEMDKFLWELEKLMKKHTVATSVIMFHPPNTTSNVIALGIIGNPSIGWCAGAGEEYFKKLEQMIQAKEITSRQTIIPNFGKPLGN
jgi:hypothetical protein